MLRRVASPENICWVYSKVVKEVAAVEMIVFYQAVFNNKLFFFCLQNLQLKVSHFLQFYDTV